MVIDENRLAALHNEAITGNPEAARELGRLLCLLPDEPDGEAWPLPHWPGEPWLRAALTARPGDTSAAVLLAGVLAQQIELRYVLGDPDSAIARRQGEALHLYRAVLRTDPGHPTARAGLEVLRRPATALTSDDTYSYYRLDGTPPEGGTARLITPDPHELRWAARSLLGAADLALTVHTPADKPHTVQLPDGLLPADLPELPGPALPPGHPVRLALDRAEVIAYYGYAAEPRFQRRSLSSAR
ncbi:hypothetical protein [Streptomyces sp. G-5]|uniref:hypothetical protein n=1 Tax=Streptomyces sp. G-5 TaxID=2977231 RepID=UPI0021CEC3B9|nr:hypothetical protein [Streptomyces sp. G-5]MCU4748598.1 hypothetical protein [Streptomyces sp. G-5]